MPTRPGHDADRRALGYRTRRPDPVAEALELEFDAPAEVSYYLVSAFTLARDFAAVRVLLDNLPLGEPLDLYNYPDVTSSGEVSLGTHKLTAGPHRLTFEITGANPSALKGHLVGLDYLRLTPK